MTDTVRTVDVLDPRLWFQFAFLAAFLGVCAAAAAGAVSVAGGPADPLVRVMRGAFGMAGSGGVIWIITRGMEYGARRMREVRQ